MKKLPHTTPLIIVAIALFAVLLAVALPARKLELASFAKDIPTFPKEIKNIKALSSDNKDAVSLTIPDGFKHFQIFADDELENLALKVRVAEIFTKHSAKLDQKASSEEEKVFTLKAKSLGKAEAKVFVLSKSGALSIKDSLKNQSTKLAKFSQAYFSKPALFKSLNKKVKALTKISKDKKSLIIAANARELLNFDFKNFSVVFYKDKGSQLKPTAKDIFADATELRFLGEVNIPGIKKESDFAKPSFSAGSSGASKGSTLDTLAAIYSSAASSSSGSSVNIPVSTPTPINSNCTCKMVLELNGGPMSSKIQRDSEGLIEAENWANEANRDLNYLSFRDENNCYTPKLKSVSIQDEGLNSPWKNHVGRRSLKFDVQLREDGADLYTREALWYGVPKNATEDICDDFDYQSVYKVTIKATFDQPKCDTTAFTTYSVIAPSHLNAAALGSFQQFIRSEHLKDSYIKTGTPEFCCVGINRPLPSSPYLCSSVQEYDAAPPAYGQFWNATKAEEEFHSQQHCSLNVPYSEGGRMGVGGPLSTGMIAKIILQDYPNDICVPLAANRWYNTPESRKKSACAKAKRLALKTLNNTLADLYTSTRTSLENRAWAEWTAKKKIGLTQTEKTGFHYACAYGRHSQFPDNNPPQPNPEEQYRKFIKDPKEYLKPYEKLTGRRERRRRRS